MARQRRNPDIHEGQTIGRFRVIRYAGRVRGTRTGWLCECTECGEMVSLEGFEIYRSGPKPCRRYTIETQAAQALAKKEARKAEAQPAAPKEKKRRIQAHDKNAPPPKETENLRVARVTIKRLAALPEQIREAVEADIHVRVRAQRGMGICIDLDRLYVEAIDVAKAAIRAGEPLGGAPPERYEARRSYQVYQGPKGA